MVLAVVRVAIMMIAALQYSHVFMVGVVLILVVVYGCIGGCGGGGRVLVVLVA